MHLLNHGVNENVGVARYRLWIELQSFKHLTSTVLLTQSETSQFLF